MVKVSKLVLKRHRWLGALMLLAMFVILFFAVNSNVQTYHNMEHDLVSTKAFPKERLKKDSDAAGFRTYEQYKASILNVYATVDETGATENSSWQSPTPENVHAVTVMWVLLMLIAGVLLTATDTLGNFDRFLNSLGKKEDDGS